MSETPRQKGQPATARAANHRAHEVAHLFLQAIDLALQGETLAA